MIDETNNQNTLVRSPLYTLLYKQLEDAIEQRDVKSVVTQLKALLVSISSAEQATVWVEFLPRLATLIPDTMVSYEVFDRAFCSWLLQRVCALPEFADGVAVRRWLAVRRDDLLNLFNLHLPDSWNILALADYLATCPDGIVPYIRDIALYETPLLNAAFHLLMSDTRTQAIAVSSFARLVKHGCLTKMQLFKELCETPSLPTAQLEELLNAAMLSPTEIRELLEDDTLHLLALPALPPLLQSFIRAYLYHFDCNDLSLTPARDFLLRLQQGQMNGVFHLTAETKALLQSIFNLDRYMNGIVLNKQWLAEFALLLNTMPSFSTHALDILIARILALLIEHITTEADLIRVLDALDIPFSTLVRNQLHKVGREENVALIELSNYRLLERLVLVLREYASYQRDAVELAPYLKVVLGEARYMLDEEQEPFITRCLFALLREIPFSIFKVLHSATLLWPLALQEMWQSYIHQTMPAYVEQLQIEEHAVANAANAGNDASVVAEQEAMNALAEEETVLALVNAYRIERHQFDIVCSLLNPYIVYEYECQPSEVYQALGLNKDDGPPTLLPHAQVHARAMEMLINDVLIQEGIDEAVQRHGVSPETFDVERHLLLQLERFQQFYGEQYATRLLERGLGEEDVLSVLRLFVRRDLFGHFLLNQIRPWLLPRWLAEKRKKASIKDFDRMH